MSISKEAIEAGARAIADAQNVPFAGRKQLLLARAALTAAAPFIQAAALREAAVDLCSEKCDDNYAPDYCETCRAAEMLHARADQLEGKTR